MGSVCLRYGSMPQRRLWQMDKLAWWLCTHVGLHRTIMSWWSKEERLTTDPALWNLDSQQQLVHANLEELPNLGTRWWHNLVDLGF